VDGLSDGTAANARTISARLSSKQVILDPPPPFRSTAASIMGPIRGQEFIEFVGAGDRGKPNF
jgi:hypothetical protein